MLTLGCGIPASPEGYDASVARSLPPDSVEEIHLVSWGCFPWACPEEALTLRSDGTARYTGSAFVERVGSFVADCPQWRFREFTELLAAVNFYSLPDEMFEGAHDTWAVSVSVASGNDGRRKTVTCRWVSLSPELMAVYGEARDVVDTLEWRRADG
jgi:hypothetical protein